MLNINFIVRYFSYIQRKVQQKSQQKPIKMSLILTKEMMKKLQKTSELTVLFESPVLFSVKYTKNLNLREIFIRKPVNVERTGKK